MGRRRSARELALRLLFEVDVGKAPLEQVWEVSVERERYDASTMEFARRLLEGTIAHCREIDKLISQYAKEWSLERMANVDRNILRLATFEILYEQDIPVSVSVDEAVELAKKYSTAESGKFVNGILGGMLRHLDEHAQGE